MQPPRETRQLRQTHIGKAAIGQIAVPLVLHLGDLAGGLVVEDVDLAGDGLFLADAFDDVAGLEVEADGVAGGGDLVVETLDFGEGGLETVLVGGGGC